MESKAKEKLEIIEKSKETLQEVKKAVIVSKNEFLETHTPDHKDLIQKTKPVFRDISRLKKERR